MDYKEFRKRFPATRVFQRYSSDERANLASSFRAGYLQRQAVGSFYYTHELCPDVAFDTAKDATTRAYGIYLEQQPKEAVAA